MTRYITNFEDSDVGEFPVGWTRRWDADEHRERNNAVVQISNPLFKRRELRIGGTNQRSVYTLDAVNSDANSHNIDMLFPFKIDTVASPSVDATLIHAWCRASGASSAAATGFRLLLGMSTSVIPNQVFVQRYQNNVLQSTPINASAFTFVPGTGYYVRWRVQDLPGSPSTVQISLTIWADTDAAEPSTPTFTATDSGGILFGVAGWAGVYAGGNSATVKAFGLINYVSIGTNGDTAVKPRTNAEFLTWLDSQQAVRRWLAEMQYYSYTASINAAGQPPGVTAYLLYNLLGLPSPTVPLMVTPSATSNQITGDISFMFDIDPVEWTTHAGGNQTYLLGKLDSTGLNIGYAVRVIWSVLNQSTLNVFWSEGGTGATLKAATSSEYLPAAAQRIKVAVEVDVDNGAGGNTVTFWLSMDNGRSWGLLGTPQTQAGVSSIFASTAQIALGTNEAGSRPYAGKMYRAEVWAGRPISDPDNASRVLDYNAQKFSAAQALSGGPYTALTGETWTGVTNGPSISNRRGYNFDYRTAYIADGGFTSSAWDSPASQHYDAWMSKVPSFSRDMGVALTGAARVTIGELGVSNPSGGVGVAGTRDTWERIKWKRDYVKLFLGDDSWPKHDFRLMVLGRLGQPKSSANEITFPIGDLSDVLNEVLQRRVYTSGTMVGKPYPLSAGVVYWIEPPLVAANEYQINDGPINGNDPWLGLNSFISLLYDNWVSVVTATATRTISAVNAATNTLTTNTAHGFVANGTYIPTGTPPAPLVAGTPYFVLAAGLTATDFRLSATVGGTEVDITGSTTGSSYYYMPGYINKSKGTLVYGSNPAGRLVIGAIKGAVGTEDGGPADILSWLVFSKFGLSLDFKDTPSFRTLATARPATTYAGNVHFPANPVLARDAVLKAATGLFCWYGFTPDGLMQVGALSTPSSTAVMSFVESDVLLGSLQMVNRVMPVDFMVAPVTYQPKQFVGGPANTNDPTFALPNFSAGPYSNNTGGIPLDLAPGSADMRADVTFPLQYTTSAAAAAMVVQLQSLFGRMIGVFTFRTRRRALTLNIGDTISLTHSKKAWKTFSASDLSSPDYNVISDPPVVHPDSTKAVVIGVALDPNQTDGFPVTVTVYRHIAGYFPTTNLNN